MKKLIEYLNEEPLLDYCNFDLIYLERIFNRIVEDSYMRGVNDTFNRIQEKLKDIKK